MAEGQPPAEGRPGRGGVIFDVDGTLLDTNYLHVTAWWDAFRERGHDVACADIHRAIGLSSEELITRVLGQPDPSVSEAHSRYVAPYLGRMRPLAGAPELLRATARLGLNVVLATSAKDEELDLMLDALGARDALDTVVSSGDVKQAKPHPEIVSHALEESGTDPARAVRSATRSGMCSRRTALRWAAVRRDRRGRTAQVPGRPRRTRAPPRCWKSSRAARSAASAR